MAPGTKWLPSQIVSCCLVGVRFVRHRALPSPPTAPYVRSPRQRLPRAASLKARPWPLCQSGSCASRPRALLRRLRFIGQADGWWSRVDALDPCRGVALLSLSPRNGAPVVFQSITPCLLSKVSIIKQAKLSLFGRDGSCCSWFNPNSHHAVMIINSQEITRVHVRAPCNCAVMRCTMESELKYNAFNPLPHMFAGESVVDV